MGSRIGLVTAMALLAIVGALSTVMATSVLSAPADDLRALDGVWHYVEDRTEGRAAEQHQPSMSSKVTIRIEDDAFVLVRSDGEIRMALDGSPTEITREGRVTRYRGEWKDGAFVYQSEPVRAPGDTRTGGHIQWDLRVTDEGLLARVAVDPPTGFTSVALYRHPQDIAMPAPAAATIDNMSWLAGAWVGTRGAGGAISMEERWSPPLGGAMLGVSRTVSRGRMSAFEFLRIVEREGGLVYIAQPGGRTPTEFVLTELGDTRAVFENPRHDFPQRIVYELSPEGRLTASISYTGGGSARSFEFGREDNGQ